MFNFAVHHVTPLRYSSCCKVINNVAIAKFIANNTGVCSWFFYLINSKRRKCMRKKCKKQSLFLSLKKASGDNNGVIFKR